MGLFAKKKDESVGLYGKHPTADDFLRINAGSAALRHLDEWLSGALAGAQRLIRDFENVYLSGPPVSFLVTSPGGVCTFGTLAPSRDRIGRQYPLVLFAQVSVELLAHGFSVIPLLGFMSRVQGMQAQRVSLDREQLVQQIQSLSVPGEAEFAAAREEQDRALDGRTLGQTFSNMTGPAEGWVVRGVQGLRTVCRDVSDGGPLPAFGIHLPLGQEMALHVSVWLRVIQEQCPRGVIPCVLWSEGCLMLYFAKLTSRALVAMWDRGWEDDTVYEVAATPNALPLPAVQSGAPLRVLLTAAS